MTAAHSESGATDLRDRLQALEDEAEIRAAIARFAHHSDDRRPEAFADLFAEDATYEIVGRFVQRGRAEILASARERFADSGPKRHVVTSTTVEVRGDIARARSYGTFVVGRDGRPSIRAVSVYEDTFVRTAAGWKCRLRVITMDSHEAR
jgi:uncharacterized protein (TIGR02246 family)